MPEGASCEFCAAPLRAGAKFCGYCGRGVTAARACAVCQQRLPADFRYCDRCGTPVAAGAGVTAGRTGSAATLDAVGRSGTLSAMAPLEHDTAPAPGPVTISGRPREERRTVTVMFADVSGFTAMSEHLDPEEVKETMNLVFDHLTREVVAQGGTVDKYMGDALMALFGAPRSYGDDAERAARAALRMQETFARLAAELKPKIGIDLKLRIGLNTGEVLAGYVGGGAHKTYTVMGDAVNVAERMESNCASGRVLVSSATQRCIAGRFVLERAGTLPVKGRHQPVETFYIVRERRGDLGDWVAQFEGLAIPHVGRRNDLAALLTGWNRMLDARRAESIYVEGPRGIGKTRLIAEFVRSLGNGRGAPLVLHASAVGNEALLEPIARAVHGFLRDRGGDPDALLAGIWARGELGAGGELSPEQRATSDTTLRVASEFLGGTLTLGAEDHVAAKTLRRLLVRSMAELISRLARTGPTLLALSDSHLADDATVELVRELLAQRAPMQLLIVLEAEPGKDMDRWMPEHGDFGIAHLGLGPLAEAELASLVAALLAPVGTVPRWVLDWIVPQCEGIPAHVIDHVSSLRALGVLAIDPETGEWRLPAERPAGLELPPSIVGVLQATLDHLTEEERLVLSAAAVIGRVFWDAALHRLFQGQLEPERIDAILQVLRGHDVLLQRARSLVPGASEWRFRSELLHEVCYSRTPQRQLRELHARIARILDGLGVTQINAALLAAHYERAEQYGPAIGAYLDAAEKLTQSYSLDEARRAVGDADRLLTSLAGRGIVDGLLTGRARLIHAEIANARGEYERAQAEGQAGLAALEYAPAGEPPVERLRARLHHAIGRSHHWRGEHGQALVEFERAVAVADKVPGELTYVVNLQASIAWSLVELGRVEEAQGLIQRTIAPFRIDQIQAATLANAVARHLDTLGEIHRRQNEPAKALVHCVEARKLREIEGNVRLLSISDENIAISKALAGDWQGAAESLSRVLAQRMSYGDPYDVTLARINLSETLLHVGQAVRACEELAKAESEARRLQATRLLHEIDKIKSALPSVNMQA